MATVQKQVEEAQTSIQMMGFELDRIYLSSIFSENGVGKAQDKLLIEFPVFTQKLLFFNLTVAGGAYLRFLCKGILGQKIKMANSQGLPATVYFHPWEIDTFVPEVTFNPIIRLVSFFDISRMKEYLNDLVKRFKFISIKDYESDLE